MQVNLIHIKYINTKSIHKQKRDDDGSSQSHRHEYTNNRFDSFDHKRSAHKEHIHSSTKRFVRLPGVTTTTRAPIVKIVAPPTTTNIPILLGGNKFRFK